MGSSGESHPHLLLTFTTPKTDITSEPSHTSMITLSTTKMEHHENKELFISLDALLWQPTTAHNLFLSATN